MPSNRPTNVIERDRTAAGLLLNASYSLRDLAEALQVTPASAYRAVWRLRQRGYTEKISDGSRTPRWGLTPAGAEYAQGVQQGILETPGEASVETLVETPAEVPVEAAVG